MGDNVLIIIDGTGRDMGITYRMINEVLILNYNVERLLDRIIDNMPKERRRLPV